MQYSYNRMPTFRCRDIRPRHRPHPVPGPHQPPASSMDPGRLGGPLGASDFDSRHVYANDDCAEALDDEGLAAWYFDQE